MDPETAKSSQVIEYSQSQIQKDFSNGQQARFKSQYIDSFQSKNPREKEIIQGIVFQYMGSILKDYNKKNEEKDLEIRKLRQQLRQLKCMVLKLSPNKDKQIQYSLLKQKEQKDLLKAKFFDIERDIQRIRHQMKNMNVNSYQYKYDIDGFLKVEQLKMSRHYSNNSSYNQIDNKSVRYYDLKRQPSNLSKRQLKENKSNLNINLNIERQKLIENNNNVQVNVYNRYPVSARRKQKKYENLNVLPKITKRKLSNNRFESDKY